MGNYIRNGLWDTVLGIGDLTIEELLVVVDEPIMFVCRDEKTIDRYLIITYDSYDRNYIIAKIAPKNLVKMLKGVMPMDEAFYSSNSIFFTRDENGVLVADSFVPTDFDSSLLPRKGAYFDLKLRFIDDYIKMLEKEPQLIWDYNLPFINQNIQIEMKYEVKEKKLINV